MVVDNDEILRAGTAAVLSAAPGVELVAAVGHDEAIGWSTEWARIDVVVVDASDSRREGDQFPGVAVVRSCRAAGSPAVVVVVSGQYLHAGVRRRMWEAGADFFFARDEGMTAGELVSVVLNPDEHRRLARDPGGLPRELGVTPSTAVNRLVDALDEPAARAALDPSARKKQDPHGPRSRWWDQLRARAAGPDGLRPVNSAGDPAPGLDAPSVRQLRRFWSAMTRADPPDRP